jgi:pilus assembly protein CpaE
MSRVVLVTASADLTERVRYATGGGFLALPHGPMPSDPAAFFQLLGGAPAPEVVILDPGQAQDQALALGAGFDRQCPGIAVILVSDAGSDIVLPAMRAGIRDILRPTADPSEIRVVLDRALMVAQARGTVAASAAGGAEQDLLPTGRVVSVASPKGGVGKTTVSTNIAVGLAQAAPRSTVLVDLDIQFGDVASALNLNPEYTLPDMVHGPASRDTMALKTFLTLHETGLYVIAGPESPAAADAVTGEDITHLLQMLATEFRFVVIDTAPGMSEYTLAALDQTTDLVLVTSMDVPGVRGLRKELNTLTELGMFTDSRHIVLNFTDPAGGLSVGDVEATIATSIDLALPRSPLVLQSVNQGIPLLQSQGKDPMTKGLRQLVTRLAPNITPPDEQGMTRRDRARHRRERTGAR